MLVGFVSGVRVLMCVVFFWFGGGFDGFCDDLMYFLLVLSGFYGSFGMVHDGFKCFYLVFCWSCGCSSFYLFFLCGLDGLCPGFMVVLRGSYWFCGFLRFF